MSVNSTIHMEEGEQVYPCRCGTTHRGPYAIYDYGHHNCFHDDPLHLIDEEIPGYFMCPGCGKTFTGEAGDTTDHQHTPATTTKERE